MTDQLALLQAADAAEALGITPSGVGRAVREGRLRAAAVTPRGLRLFTREAVEEYNVARRGRAALRRKNTAA